MTISKILLVGCGNMAGAMLEGWLAGGMAGADFTIVDPMRENAPGGLPVLRELPNSGEFDGVLLGVKPQMLGDVGPQVEPLVGEGTVMLSLLAGVEVDSLRRHFPRGASHIRVMPNLSVALGKAPIALAGPADMDAAFTAQIDALMAPLGTAQWIGEERMDLVTALVGSGPAFVYRFIDALKVAAVRLGLDEAQAGDLALAMVGGAATLAAQSEHDPGKLADMVASKGGVTREGLNVLDADEALVNLLTQTLSAARDRGAEMAKEARN